MNARKVAAGAGLVAALAAIAAVGIGRFGDDTKAGGSDIVIYAATPAGILAATAAAERGKTVTLLAPDSHLGGMLTSGLSITDYWGSRHISGPTRAVFEAIGARYGRKGPSWSHEPKVAEAVLRALLKRHPSITLVTGATLRDVGKRGARIESVVTTAGRFEGEVFVDASYEGDLLAKAGVSYTIGRESKDRFGESLAGIGFATPACAYCTKPISPVDAAQNPLPLIEPRGNLPEGAADDRVMNYNFRLCLTKDAGNRRPIPEPKRYDPSRFEFFSRVASALPGARVTEITKRNPGLGYRQATRQIRSAYFNLTALPNGKYDLNSGSVFLLELPGGSHDWPDATAERRRRIYAAHVEYTLQYFKWIKTDPAVPDRINSYIADFGLCADEWPGNGSWPPLLYVREARRMASDYVMTQNDIEKRANHPDTILAAFAPVDAKSVRLVMSDDGTTAVKDGAVYKTISSFTIPYRAIVPGRRGASNLLVPVAVSASHIAYSAIRMEPILMGLGTAAGEAAALASERNVAVQDIDVAELQKRIRAAGQRTHFQPKPEQSPRN